MFFPKNKDKTQKKEINRKKEREREKRRSRYLVIYKVKCRANLDIWKLISSFLVCVCESDKNGD
jgi:hypothetical protein